MLIISKEFVKIALKLLHGPVVLSWRNADLRPFAQAIQISSVQISFFFSERKVVND